MNSYRSSFAQRTRSVWVMLLSAAIAALLFSACGGGTTATSTPTATSQATATPTPTATSTTSAPVAVKIVEANEKYSFSPSTLTIKVGTTVVWTNTSDAPHTVTSDTAGVFGSTTTISRNQTFSFTFTTAGTFPYHCKIHPYMKATIVVTS